MIFQPEEDPIQHSNDHVNNESQNGKSVHQGTDFKLDSEARIHEICPVCESTVCSIRCKLVCPNCHHIVQACCD